MRNFVIDAVRDEGMVYGSAWYLKSRDMVRNHRS